MNKASLCRLVFRLVLPACTLMSDWSNFAAVLNYISDASESSEPQRSHNHRESTVTLAVLVL